MVLKRVLHWNFTIEWSVTNGGFKCLFLVSFSLGSHNAPITMLRGYSCSQLVSPVPRIWYLGNSKLHVQIVCNVNRLPPTCNAPLMHFLHLKLYAVSNRGDIAQLMSWLNCQLLNYITVKLPADTILLSLHYLHWKRQTYLLKRCIKILQRRLASILCSSARFVSSINP